MSKLELIGALYFLFGFVAVARVLLRTGGGLGCMDLFVCAISAVAWPLVLLGDWLGRAMTSSAMTKKRFFVDKEVRPLHAWPPGDDK